MEMGIFMGAFTDENFEVSHRAGFFRDRFKDFTGKTMAAVAGADFFLALRVGHGSPVSSQMRPVSNLHHFALARHHQQVDSHRVAVVGQKLAELEQIYGGMA